MRIVDGVRLLPDWSATGSLTKWIEVTTTTMSDAVVVEGENARTVRVPVTTLTLIVDPDASGAPTWPATVKLMGARPTDDQITDAARSLLAVGPVDPGDEKYLGDVWLVPFPDASTEVDL